MRVTYSAEADAAYIYFRAIEDGGVARTLNFVPWPNEPSLNADFDEEGRLIGIEVLGASRHLPESLLGMALHPLTDGTAGVF